MTGASSATTDTNEDLASRDIDEDESVGVDGAWSEGARQGASTGDRPEVKEGIEILANNVTRCYLNAMSLGWFTVQELAEMFDTPLSTAYRKVNALEQAGLLKRRVRMNSTGKHPEEYRCRSISITIVIGEATGLEMRLQAISDEHSNDSG